MEALDWLFQQFPSYQLIGSKAFKPTLDNTHQILDLLENPQNDLKFIHVAGSNGKGSVSSYIASILKEKGLKVGLFTSPHIAHFSERIRVNGAPIEESEIEAFVSRIRNTKLPFSPSFFEITFGMALEHFKKKHCDICVIETGLGGRLDATNVVTPELSIITSISLEHTNMLGDTLEAIAGEKAGIVKPNTPVIIGDGCNNTLQVFENKARTENAPFIKSKPISSALSSLVRADYQKENVATVLTAIDTLFPDIDEQTIVKGIRNVSKNTGYYGRMQLWSTDPDIIFDVSHNADGLEATFKALLDLYDEEIHVVYGTSGDKDLNSIKNIFPSKIHFYGTEFSNERSAKKETLKNTFSEIPFKSKAYFDDPKIALDVARSHASQEDAIVVIGSFFLLSDFF